MTFPSVSTERLNGRLGRREENLYGICGMVLGGVAVVGGLQLNTVYTLKQLSDLEALLVDAAYDTTNKVLFHHHVKRFFMRNPSGELWILAVAQTTTQSVMVTKTSTNGVKQLLKAANGRIKCAVGTVRNPATGYTPTITAGIDNDVNTAVPLAQALIDEENQEFRYCRILLEGRSFSGVAADITNLRAIPGVNAQHVGVVLGADNQISALDALYNGYAAIGDILGMLSKADLSQNLGELDQKFNLTNVAEGAWIIPGFSSNTKVSAFSSANIETLNSKGYIFGTNIPGIEGCWINDSHACVPLTSDYAYLENSRVIDKMLERVRLAMLPKLKSRIRVDEKTGYMLDADRLALEDLGKGELNLMTTDGDLSGGVDVWIAPDQNLLSGANLIVEATAIPVAIGRQIKIKVGFSNPLV